MNLGMNSSDLMLYDDDRIKKFLKKNRGVLDNKDNKGSCNRNSLELVRIFKDYGNRYAAFQKIAFTIFLFISNNDELDFGLGIRLMNIIKSVKKQYLFYWKIKETLKKVPVGKEDYFSIKRAFKHVDNRLNHLYKNVLPEYLKVTPAYSYMKQLESDGKTLEEDASEFLQLKPFCDVGDDQRRDYYEYIISNCKDDSWKANLEEYKAINEKRLAIINKEKMAEKAEKQNRKYEDSLAYLENYGRTIYKNFMKGQDSVNARAVSKIGIATSEFDKKSERCKIVLLMNTGCRSTQSIKYFCKDAKDYRSCMSKATIIPDSEKLPADLEKLIADKKVVSCEIVLN